MRPCTPHYVLTTDHSITMGRHFYAASTITRSCLGMVHCFVMSTSITNTVHDNTRALLHRLMSMWYNHYCVRHLKSGKYSSHLVGYTITDEIH